MTDSILPRRLELLRSLGAGEVRHNSEEDLLPHLLGTRKLLRSWGAREELLDAGLFHSIYGTEFFATETFRIGDGAGEQEQRDRLRAEIGPVAEELVYLWCFGKRWSLAQNLSRGTGSADAEDRPLSMADRRGGPDFVITQGNMRDLVELWIADTLEQIDRVVWRELPTARALPRYEEFASDAALEALHAEISRRAGQVEPTSQTSEPV